MVFEVNENEFEEDAEPINSKAKKASKIPDHGMDL
jgi:hypothetical protein